LASPLTQEKQLNVFSKLPSKGMLKLRGASVIFTFKAEE
jgi:hypothetical protein